MPAEPGPQPMMSEERLDACLAAVADFADLKSMWTVGHSRGVAELAEASLPSPPDVPAPDVAAAAPGGAGARHRPGLGTLQRLG